MKFINLNPKRFFPSKKRSEPSSSFGSASTSSSSTVSGETKNIPDGASPYSHIELLKAFKLVYRDNDGAVSRHDPEALLIQLGPHPPNVDDISVMLREVDRDSLETPASRVVSSDSSTSTALRETTFKFFDMIMAFTLRSKCIN
ncbi:unnamed protein product [Microthlaspi erraticum]|uniref:EF-hand domain-containing protein n=1 Tax=Microthlaspi erraticum TaxID=1685480 RepID=A0A6D2K6T7_9BRAS|nr:unnamed protein product [Microthlaspi erraticum]